MAVSPLPLFPFSPFLFLGYSGQISEFNVRFFRGFNLVKSSRWHELCCFRV
jgi:hypothetical protein